MLRCALMLTPPPPPLPWLLTVQSTSDDAVPIRWQCPEAVTTRVYTAKSDVYSFGVLLYEIYSGGATPYAELATAEVIRFVQAGQRLRQPRPDTPADIVALMRECTSSSVASRPSMQTVMARLTGSWTLDAGPTAGSLLTQNPAFAMMREEAETESAL